MPIFNSVIELIIFWMVCGVICYFIMKSKSYNNNECLLGGVARAVLSIVGIIICLCMKEKILIKLLKKRT